MMEDRSVESAHQRETQLALVPTEPALVSPGPMTPKIVYDSKPTPESDSKSTPEIVCDSKPTPELVPDAKPSPLTALNSVTRQLAKVNVALTELRFASERRETTALMLARINAEWDVLDARLKVLAKASLEHDQWTHRPVEKVCGRRTARVARSKPCASCSPRSVWRVASGARCSTSAPASSSWIARPAVTSRCAERVQP